MKGKKHDGRLVVFAADADVRLKVGTGWDLRKQAYLRRHFQKAQCQRAVYVYRPADAVALSALFRQS